MMNKLPKPQRAKYELPITIPSHSILGGGGTVSRSPIVLLSRPERVKRAPMKLGD